MTAPTGASNGANRVRGDDDAGVANTYVIDPEDTLEMARLVLQDRLITTQTGGLFPERAGDLAPIRSVLDLACGAGGWALQVAQAYPQVTVTGVDISGRMVEYARAQALVFRLGNVRFRQMDVLRPLGFPDATFDLVNARLLLGFMPPAAWPTLVAECRRMTRPGGILRLTEAEYAISNKPACEALGGLITAALARAGQSFSPDGRHIGITPMLSAFLREAGYGRIGQMAHVLDASAGTEAHDVTYQDALLMLKLIHPFLVRTGVATAEEVEELRRRALEEMLAEDYRAISFWLTVWGEVPA